MFVAGVTVHRKNAFFVATNGLEHPLIMATAAVGLGLTGPGRFSLDAALGNYTLLTPAATWIILGIGLVGGIANLAVRRPAAAPRV
jgi:putative oxidoreductase